MGKSFLVAESTVNTLCHILLIMGRHCFPLILLIVVGYDQSLIWSLGFLVILLLFIRSNIKTKLLVNSLKAKNENIVVRGFAAQIFIGSLTAAVLASADRIYAPLIFDSQSSGDYVSAFILASSLSLLPLRFTECSFRGSLRHQVFHRQTFIAIF